MSEELITTKDVRRMIRCSEALIYKWADEGRIPCVRIPCPGHGKQKKRLLRFKHDDVTRFIEAYYRR